MFPLLVAGTFGKSHWEEMERKKAEEEKSGKGGE